MTRTPYPDLNDIAYRNNDQGDHPGGGHCVGLPDTDADRWLLVLDQHARAFRALARRALDSEDGWALARPLLFAAHHTCEVALKRVLVQQLGSVGGKEHRLADLWQRLTTILPQGLSQSDISWMGDFIETMGDLTMRGFDGRYPDEPNDVGDEWCCISIVRLEEAVEHFVLLTLTGSASEL